MTITHHPSDETLARYAAGNLKRGPSVVIGTHLALCPACRAHTRCLTSLMGEELRTAKPTAMAEDALAATMARLDAPAPQSPPQAAAPRNPDLPGPLAHIPIERWRWLAPGIHMAKIGPREPGVSLFLLRCAPGSQLPAHRHMAGEYACILKGSYHDAVGHYGVGDTEEANADLSHAPQVDNDSECIAVIAVEGKMIMQGFLPRLLQPLFGI